MPTDSTIPFDRLTTADLHVGAIYLGGTKGRAADDPLAKLLPVGNQAEFRPHESFKHKTARLSVRSASVVRGRSGITKPMLRHECSTTTATIASR